ncbi:hypothetical protein [Flavisphingomonas formosensis]|uniref:hypothetical protein n=1 Tax=Flavisphingomonas formosensis TaxID=861534 RepID=UPI0012F7211B|nr:hypothetical protein [Sphingomonas formosensis]
MGSDELVQGLMLVRASTMKVIRLQLAMERRDRRLALQTMDDLVDLDGRIRDFLQDIPVSPTVITRMQREMEEQRICLAREKFTLTAGVGKASAAVPGWIEPPPAAGAGLPESTDEIYAEPAAVERAGDDAETGRPWPVLLLALLFLVTALVCAGMLIGTGAWNELIARLTALTGTAL